MTQASLESASFWWNAAVVGCGLAAAISAVFAMRASSRLEASKDAVLARFQVESNKAIASADARAAEANQKAAEANERAAEANERAAVNELKAIELSKLLEDERGSRVTLDRRTANRDIPVDRLKSLSATLSMFAGQTAELMIFPVHFESVSIAAQIEVILLDAKWTIPPPKRLVEPPNVQVGTLGRATPLIVQGIYIQATGDEESKAAGSALFEALRSTVASGVWSPVALPGQPRVLVIVGDKPTPLSSWVRE